MSSDHYRKVQPARFLKYDLTKNFPLPFKDYAVELAYCSHTIEHIKDDNAENLFREVFRVLGRGGVFRITCPDADLFYYAAKLGDFSAFGFRTNHWFSKIGIAPETVRLTDYLVRAVADRANPTKRVSRDANPVLSKETEEKFNSLPK
ncbi:MAG: class I SAM-dependent methyltransferase [Hyphomicrobiales bacterium]